LTERAASSLFADETSSVDRLMSQFSACDFATAMMAADVCGYLPDDILVKVDRASMHFALQVRCPFLDARLLNFAFALPPASKISLRHTKILLRQLAAQRLPRKIIDRPSKALYSPWPIGCAGRCALPSNRYCPAMITRFGPFTAERYCRSSFERTSSGAPIRRGSAGG
jgi:asparagine synthetase B (glutamine-hydrolysing)